MITTELILGRLYGDGPRHLEYMPYPKPYTGLRQFAVLDAIDEMALRMAMARPAIELDKAVSESVYSSRLIKGPPGWYFRRRNSAFRRLKSAASSLIRAEGFCELGKTDVTAYYPTIDLEVLSTIVSDLIGDDRDVDLVIEWLREWQQRDGLVGLPIGPDGSGLFGNAYLVSIDKAVHATGADLFRYTDDVYVVRSSESSLSWHELLPALDSKLAAIGLNRNVAKTTSTSCPETALELITDSAIDYLDDGLRHGRAVTFSQVIEMFDHETSQESPSPNRFAFALGVLGRHKSDYALKVLLEKPSLCQLNPRRVGDYLKRVASRHPKAKTTMLELLEVPITQRTEAVHLHTLRAASAQTWGDIEAEEFERIAFDKSRAVSVRGWAFQAAGGTRRFDADRATDFAVESSSTLARAAVLAQQRMPRSRARAMRMTHVSHRRTDLRPTCDWVMERS